MFLVFLTLFASPIPCLWCPLLCLPLPSHVFGVPYPVCLSHPMSLVPLTLFAPPLPCFWCSLPFLSLPSHVFGAPHSVCPSPPMFLVFLTRFASPIPCLSCTPYFVCPPSSTYMYLNPPIYIVWSLLTCLAFYAILLIIQII